MRGRPIEPYLKRFPDLVAPLAASWLLDLAFDRPNQLGREVQLRKVNHGARCTESIVVMQRITTSRDHSPPVVGNPYT
jgi:hypothetical protein